MKTRRQLREAFAVFVPDFMLKSAAEKCANRWEDRQKDYQVRANVDKLVDDLTGLFTRFIYADPMFGDPRKKKHAMSCAVSVLNLIKDDSIDILKKVGKNRSEVSDQLKELIMIRLDEFMRSI